MNITLFYIPTPSEAEAERIGQHLLHKKLVACIHIFPVQSAYPWQGQLQSDNEVILLMKTLPECAPVITTEVQQLHSYAIPAILHWTAEVNDAYADWIEKEVVIP